MNMKILLNELKNCRNELCLKCGSYRNSHNGACNDCRYNFDNMTKWDAIEERPVGHWVIKCEKYYDGVTCSVCGELLPCSDEYRYITDYCPNCGAYMGGNDNG